MTHHTTSARATDDYVRRVMIACDDLYDDPFDDAARTALRALLDEGEESPTPPVARVRRSRLALLPRDRGAGHPSQSS